MSYVYLFTFDICKTLTWEKGIVKGLKKCLVAIFLFLPCFALPAGHLGKSINIC